MATVPGKKYASIKRPRVYRALRRRGFSKTSAAKVSNSKGGGGKKGKKKR